MPGVRETGLVEVGHLVVPGGHERSRTATCRPLPTATVEAVKVGSAAISARNGATSPGWDRTLSIARTPPGRRTRWGCGHQPGYSGRSASRNSRSTLAVGRRARKSPPSAVAKVISEARPALAALARAPVAGAPLDGAMSTVVTAPPVPWPAAASHSVE